MLSDLIIIFAWWFFLFLLGLVCLPLTFRFFGRFWDQGYSFSKIIALLLVSYLVWLLGSLKIVSFTQGTVWLIVILLGFFIWKKKNFKLESLIKKNGKVWVVEEGLFFLCLLFWALVRSFQPDINGLEKFMDYGFLNSILKSGFFPPKDMWMSGETINYYYFGHLVTAVLTKLSGIDSALTYNLMMATIFALSFTAAFSLASNLIQFAIRNGGFPRNAQFAIISGLLSAFLLTLGGNLQLFWYFLKNKTLTGYWYPDATRFIVQKFGAADNTIHEFPIYSFVVADLHGHLLDLPFVLLFLALVLVIFSTPGESIRPLPECLCSLVLAAMFMANAWDLPIYLLVLGGVLLAKMKRMGKAILLTLGYLFLAICFSLPFHLNFQSIAKGIGLVDFHSPLWMLFFLWGFPLLITVSFAAFSFYIKKEIKPVDIFVLLLLAVSWFLIFLPEIFYVKDIYIHSYQRANTIFKLTYQSFVMFSLCSGYIIVRILTRIKKKPIKNLFVICHLSFVILLLIYPYFAIKSYYGLTKYQGLNGLEYLQLLYPDDYQAILWLRKNIKNQPVILEAVGESYTDFARVSANTGLPTVLGWPVHEWLWRGSYDEPGQRREEVRKIYELKDEEETKKLLDKYQVEYVFLGSLENRGYKNLNEEKFNRLGKIVFQQGKTAIHQIID